MTERIDAIPLSAFEPPIDLRQLRESGCDLGELLRDQALLAKLGEQTKLEARARDMVQVRALLAAGWKYELPEGHHDLEPMSWYWRSPPKRAGSRGRKYLSTNQAHSAMERAKKCDHPA